MHTYSSESEFLDLLFGILELFKLSKALFMHFRAVFVAQ